MRAAIVAGYAARSLLSYTYTTWLLVNLSRRCRGVKVCLVHVLCGIDHIFKDSSNDRNFPKVMCSIQQHGQRGCVEYRVPKKVEQKLCLAPPQFFVERVTLK